MTKYEPVFNYQPKIFTTKKAAKLKLAACPFFGGTNVSTDVGFRALLCRSYVVVKCGALNCQAEGPCRRTDEGAISGWNRAAKKRVKRDVDAEGFKKAIKAK